MPIPDVAELLIPVALCLLALALVLRRPGPKRGVARQLLREAEASVVFLFDGDMLVDATPRARDLLRGHDRRANEREVLLKTLAQRFPTLRQRLQTLPEAGLVHLSGEVGEEWIEAEYWEGLVRLSLHGAAGGAAGFAPLTLAAMEEELETLRSLGEDAPQLIWRQDADGTVSWANRAYLDTAARAAGAPAGAAPSWPPPAIFGEIDPPEADGAGDQQRRAVRTQSGEELWFEVTSVRRGDSFVHFALDAAPAVRAEIAQRNFVQTLSKTFADLAIGLAIFDRDRRLVMFNPSLMDLTRLPIDFLATKPPIQSFLDRLRELRMLPEPRNYRSWREELAALVAEASEGTYCETWMLPAGQTFRVTGRPHPDGAIAFLIEDITAEMSLTRRFRTQIDTANAVFDTLDEAIAVFGPTGTLTMANAAYDGLWARPAPPPGDGELPLREPRLGDEIDTWRGACAPTDLWADIRDSAAGVGERRPWSGRARRDDGRVMRCRVAPLPGGATLVGFSLTMEEAGLRPLLPSPQPRAENG
ncbi:PAS-domain containing protein [Oceanicola granulosus]|nr:PAS-domain containing protein [Oceanicola granulosus]